MSQSYVTFGISDFSKVFPPPPYGRRLPFSPICESRPWGSASVFLCLCLSQPRPYFAFFSSVVFSIRGCIVLQRDMAQATKCLNLTCIQIWAAQLKSCVISGKCLCLSELVSVFVYQVHLKK